MWTEDWKKAKKKRTSELITHHSSVNHLKYYRQFNPFNSNPMKPLFFFLENHCDDSKEINKDDKIQMKIHLSEYFDFYCITHFIFNIHAYKSIVYHDVCTRKKNKIKTVQYYCRQFFFCFFPLFISQAFSHTK